MAPPPVSKNKPAPKPVAADDTDLDHIPIQKTSPIVYLLAVVALLVVAGLGAFMMYSKKADKAKADAAAAAFASAHAAALESKAAEEEKRRQMELAIKALEVGSEKEREAAAAAAAASAAAAEDTEGAAPKTASVGGAPPAGGGDAPPAPTPKRGGPASKDLDDLDKLGNDTNTALGGK